MFPRGKKCNLSHKKIKCPHMAMLVEKLKKSYGCWNVIMKETEKKKGLVIKAQNRPVTEGYPVLMEVCVSVALAVQYTRKKASLFILRFVLYSLSHRQFVDMLMWDLLTDF